MRLPRGPRHRAMPVAACRPSLLGTLTWVLLLACTALLVLPPLSPERCRRRVVIGAVVKPPVNVLFE